MKDILLVSFMLQWHVGYPFVEIHYGQSDCLWSELDLGSDCSDTIDAIWHQCFLNKMYFIFSVQQLWDFPTQISFQEYVLWGEQLKDNTQLAYFELQQDAHPLCSPYKHNLSTE